jgi:hypothetical protein
MYDHIVSLTMNILWHDDSSEIKWYDIYERKWNIEKITYV